MSKTLLKLDIIGFVFVSVIGTLAHFVFEWSGNNTVDFLSLFNMDGRSIFYNA